ncbi:MAG TPA: DUF5691 domain-containing protein, partial [Trebonia sp.]|nr:DUF5691 domain-containing protein [Trebonia sp.]
MSEPASESASAVPPGRTGGGPYLAVPYDELVTTATVGLSRRPLPGAGLGAPAPAHAGGHAPDAADVLLEAAALHVTARRAGMRARTGIAPPPPMAADDAPELPARAAAVLRQVLTDASLLADLLAAAAAAGYRAPAPLLPVLLDAAARTVALRPAVVAALGPRGRWLAARRPQWQRLTDSDDAAGEGFPGDGAPRATDMALTGPSAASGNAAAGGHGVTGGDTAAGAGGGRVTDDGGAAGPAADPACDPRAWETGSRPQRAAYLARLRGRDPEAARELLAAGWSQETAEERAELLGALARGLSPADEDFLEAALDDRAAKVRAVARTALERLPGSALRQRAAQRAAPVLWLRADGDRQWLAAALPAGPPDAAMTRDGIVASPPAAGIGTGSWLLTQLIAAVPLGWWPGQFGLGPAAIAAL